MPEMIDNPQSAVRSPQLPIADLKSASETIVARWNAAIPCNHVRFVNVTRWRLIVDAVQCFGLERILKAVEYYGGRPWQRKNRAWRKFDAFMAPDVLTQWVEESLDAERAAEEKAAPGSPEHRAKIVDIQKKVAHVVREQKNRWRALREKLAGLPDERRKEIFDQATDECRRHFGRVTGPAVERQCLIVLDRESK